MLSPSPRKPDAGKAPLRQFALPASYLLEMIDAFLDGTGLDVKSAGDLLGQVLPQPQDPSKPLPLSDHIRLFKACCAASPQPGFGLAFGTRLSVSSHGLMGYAALTAPTVRDALIMTSQLFETHTGLLVFSHQLSDSGDLQLAWREALPLYMGRQDVMEAVLAALVRGINDIMPGSRGTLRWQVDWPAPAHTRLYRETLGHAGEFGARYCSLSVPAAVANGTPPLHNASAFRLCEKLLRRHHRTLSAGQPLHLQVAAFLAARQPPFPDLGTTAEHFAMSARTFRKRLYDEGYNYRDICSRDLMIRARHFLMRSNLSIGEISDRLGFSDSCNFTRAFRRVEGVSPVAYRKAQQSRAGSKTG